MNKNNLIQLIRDHALISGKVQLASGKISDYYLDLSKVVYLEKGLQRVLEGVEDFLWDFDDFDSIGGPAMGAIPLITGMMTYSGIERSFFVRKESKEYGKKDLIEGNLRPGDRVLMLEDVVTTGGSLYKAIQAVEDFGAKVIAIVAVVDREEGAVEFFKEKGYTFKSILTVSDIK